MKPLFKEEFDMFSARIIHVLAVVAFASMLTYGVYILLEPIVKALAI
jgi:hypothetical protein